MSSSDTKPDHYNINAKICRLVEQYPCMYDRSHPHYLKKDVVDLAWLKISKEMNDSISSCKERWRNIRTSYARSINVNKVPASANRTKPYYLHEELQFLALHITPGIPVSRRSTSNNYTTSNSFYTSPRNEKSGDITKTSMCDESIDSYAVVMHEDKDDKTQSFNHEEERSSSSENSEATSKNTQEMETQELPAQAEVTQQQQQQQLQPPQQQQPVRQASPVQIVVADNDTEEPEFHPPMVHIEEDNVELQIENDLRRNTINYACAPPKKRLRVKDNSYASDNFIDPKPVDVLPQHDYDGVFLQSLLPEMKAMDFRQKILFKRRIYEVLSEIFDNSTQATSTSSLNPSTSSSGLANALPLMVVNPADLNMLRRLNNILQDTSATNGSSSSGSSCQNTFSTPARSASISSTVNSTHASPSSATMPAAKIGATTRSSSNVARVRLVNPNVVVIPAQNVKEEPETN